MPAPTTSLKLYRPRPVRCAHAVIGVSAVTVIGATSGRLGRGPERRRPMIEVLVDVSEINDKDAGDAVLRVVGLSNGDCLLTISDGMRLRIHGLDLIEAIFATVRSSIRYRY